MCTLSLQRKANGYALSMNRDERHDRMPELPPRQISSKRGIRGPLDPESGGTWVAYNENGYWGALLNGYFEDSDFAPSTADNKSRGSILIDLLQSENPIAAARKLNYSDYLSFRLLIGSSTNHVLYQWNRESFEEVPFHAEHENRFFFLSSSSWRQEEVIQHRKTLFTKWIETDRSEIDGIPSFHHSTAPSPESAPMMMRDYSGTKSITKMEIAAGSIEMSYQRVQESAEIEALS